MLNQNTHTHIYSEPGPVIDYNISLFRTASRSNYAIIDYTMLQSPGIVIFRNGIFHWPVCISRVKEYIWKLEKSTYSNSTSIYSFIQ